MVVGNLATFVLGLLYVLERFSWLWRIASIAAVNALDLHRIVHVIAQTIHL